MGLGQELNAGAASGYQRLSLWGEGIDVPLPPRPALTEDLDVDVCIVGAGFTGLWTAHALASADPSLRVVVLGREGAGFGGSGAKGRWVRGAVRRLRRPPGPPPRSRCHAGDAPSHAGDRGPRRR